MCTREIWNRNQLHYKNVYWIWVANSLLKNCSDNSQRPIKCLQCSQQPFLYTHCKLLRDNTHRIKDVSDWSGSRLNNNWRLIITVSILLTSIWTWDLLVSTCWAKDDLTVCSARRALMLGGWYSHMLSDQFLYQLQCCDVGLHSHVVVQNYMSCNVCDLQ